ncbi:hypothetical protein A2641_03600 [Candidatus Nomurabacteria bacterium RIFCSPHIGHO2_01_FULL_37_25]|uniref:Baseplate protein J-like domain-containing protein n=1 Tax=Candidatus Nomurabacteria bacterium RIFCSPLOWO2_01_FULL_36_16 TaxID=1801767 RepID=A0A1F6WY05_9BACT|nr:MAG: hypothetical protein A2641_03600 [Candidatus Nomurabacteria bacterium RIFCSPHIGHO2_01_FULL_37_25]OGI75122.1 MAG: hypothetical protein A3D36_00755 [Candidatus Nomurabacteria bacterium RIFCSPHIGHO2_02_FULL_36_29]OGI86777.1 MAG: hypothetical protein A3A91_00965 [Candidatus Nomurabacteria bacterium RIFCSPLOWO2_01_FULL_36_16]OGI96449.1 MAG: hypothetical protein A3I84_00430 [Candidatus Nomurabacteria bacterium RIFCSPLOWO2_02_FULL_36_8]
MSKYLLQDMIKAKNANQQTQIPQKKARFDTVLSIKNSARNNTDNVSRGQVNGTRYTLWSVAIISIIFFLFSLSYLFLSAVVTVNPKIQEITLNESLSATKDSNKDGLFFNLLVDNVSGEEKRDIQANEQKDVSNKAVGTAVIFNFFSSSPQRLSIDTRLEGSNGKIYKTQKQLIVPGMKNDTPGSIEVDIYGAEAGEEYNSGPLDFSIFGFKGSPKYSKFKVRTKTGTKITGGFIGKVNVISDTDKAAILTELNSSLKTKLLAKATNQIPPGFILFKDAIFLNTEEPIISLTPDQNNNFTITLKGTLFGFLLNEQKLTQKIAQDNIDKYDGSDVYISNIRNLTFSISTVHAQEWQTNLSDKKNIPVENLQKIDFNLSGVAKIVWKLDENQLINDFLGKSKKDFNQILSEYDNIDSANLKISPFWKTSLPDKIKNIKIIINYPK